MAVDMEGLEFQIQANSDGAVKSVDALTNSLGRLKNATKGLQGLSNASDKLGKLNQALAGFHTDALEKLGNALSAMNGAKISSTIPKRIAEIATASKSLSDDDVDRLERMANAISSIGAAGNVKLPNLQTPNVTGNPADAAAQGAQDSGIGQAASETQQLSDALSQATGRSNILKSVLSGIGGVFSKGFHTGVGVLKKLGSGLSTVASGAKKAYNAMMYIPHAVTSKLIGSIKQATSSLGGLFGHLKRIAMYRAIRAAIAAFTQGLKEGINNLYNYSALMDGQFAGSMDRLATSAQYLKNSLGAMAAPIINALAPAIDFLIDKIAALLNMINMLISRLTGKSTFTAAKKVAAAYGGAADAAAGSAKKAIDKIKSYTVGIDELNIIQDNPDNGSGGGGGGGGGTDYGSMFEELPIDKNISDFADKLREAFDNADWKTLGTLLGEKVNEIVDSIDWGGIGHKVGFALNGAIQTAYWFLDTVNFTNIGSRIAEFLNGALEEIDFSYIGRLLVKKMTIIWDMIIGFFTTLDWGLVAQKISEFVKGIFDEFTKWLNSHDWAELGSLLWEKIKDFVSNIDYAGIATSFFTFLGTAIRSAALFIGNFIGGIAQDIANWWNEDIKGADFGETASNLWNAFKKALGNIGKWVWNNIIDPFMSALLGEKWDDVKEVGSNIWGKVKEGWDAVCKLAGNIGQFFVNVKNDAAKWWSNTKQWWANKVGAVQEFWTGVKNSASDWWNNVKSWWSGKVGKVKEFTTAVTNQASTWWANTKTWWSQKVGKVKEFWTWVTNQAGSWWSDVKSWWSGKVGKVKEFWTWVTNQSASWWSDVKTWWSGKVGKVKEFWTWVTNQSASWWSDVKTWWSGKVGKVKEFWTWVTNQSAQWWSDVKTWWSGKVGQVQKFTTDVKNEASTWWSNCKSYWSGVVGMVQKFTTAVVNDSATWWSNVKTWWSGKVGAVQSFTVGVVNSASQWWSDVKTWWSNAVGTLWTTLGIKLPHVTVSWYKDPIFGKVDLPSFSVEWYAQGGILDGAQLFGMLGNNFLGGGEAGAEAVLPLERHTEWMDTIAEKVKDILPGDSGDGETSGVRRVIEHLEALESSIDRMAADMKRQADKSEKTTVQIGNKTVRDAVVTQEKADGYRFTK